MTAAANWSYPTAVRFGADRIAELPKCCAAAGMKRPLLVTDRGLAGLPVTARTQEILEAAGLGSAMFSEVATNPDDASLAAGVAAFRDGGCDGVVAFGGGSALDLGKAVALMQGHEGSVFDYAAPRPSARVNAAAVAPIVAVPTTAGTGSEVGNAAVITNAATHEKRIVMHRTLLPSQVIADPALTVGMPPMITAGTGMDALAHHVEAFCAPGFHPMSEGIAVEGVRLVLDSLGPVMRDPENLELRGRMLGAALTGSVAFQKGLGAVHAISHPVGAAFDCHHGAINAVLLPAVLRANADAVAGRMERLAAFCGVSGGLDGFIAAVEALREELGLPARLRDLGVAEDRLEEIAKAAPTDPTAYTNPVRVTEDYALAVLRASF